MSSSKEAVTRTESPSAEKAKGAVESLMDDPGVEAKVRPQKLETDFKKASNAMEGLLRSGFRSGTRLMKKGAKWLESVGRSTH